MLRSSSSTTPTSMSRSKAALVCKFRNSGQTCVSANRILVQDGIYDEFARALHGGRRGAQGRATASPRASQVGPLIDEPAVEKVESHVADALDAGRRARASAASRHRGRSSSSRRCSTGVDAGHGDEPRGDVRPGRRDQPLRDRGRGDRDRERHAVRPRGVLLHPRPRRAPGASPRRSSTGSSASTRASSRPRSRRSAASRSRASAARGRATASTTGSSSSTWRWAAEIGRRLR